MIPRETIDRIYSAAKIEEVVSDYVTLRKRGANLIGLCPFHNEKTGSFTVSPSKGIYKCFGCGASGHALKFIMEIEQCSFVEAVKQLYETERRRSRNQMAVAFASGGVTGAIAAVCFLLHPIHVANPAAQPSLKLFSWMLEHSDILVPALTVAILAVCAAVATTQVYGILKKDYTI